jgi:MoxR-like ATPase
MTDDSPGPDAPLDESAVERLKHAHARMKAEIGKLVVGQHAAVEHMLIAMLCRGHALMLGVPGLGKTLMAHTMAQALKMQFRRIQFTPDLMPSDITGTDIIEEDAETGRRRLEFFPGPVFTNFLLADEINRAPPKTQAALLQAMQEREITVGRNTYQLSPPFFVVATQNPIEQEGTYPLPEAQLDRFMFNIPVTYPTPQEEVEIVKQTTANRETAIEPMLEIEEILHLQRLVRGMPVSDSIVEYAVALASESRPELAKHTRNYHRLIRNGASPRASQYLILGAKATAILAGKFHVDFRDVQDVAVPVLRHRIILNFHARAENVGVDQIIQQMIQTVPCR